MATTASCQRVYYVFICGIQPTKEVQRRLPTNSIRARPRNNTYFCQNAPKLYLWFIFGQPANLSIKLGQKIEILFTFRYIFKPLIGICHHSLIRLSDIQSDTSRNTYDNWISVWCPFSREKNPSGGLSKGKKTKKAVSLLTQKWRETEER